MHVAFSMAQGKMDLNPGSWFQLTSGLQSWVSSYEYFQFPKVWITRKFSLINFSHFLKIYSQYCVCILLCHMYNK